MSGNLGLDLSEAHGGVCLERLKFICDLGHFHFALGEVKRLDCSLELAHSAGIFSLLKDDEASQVCLKTVCVQFQGFFGLVDTTVVDSNSDRSGVFGAKSGSLKLFEGESLSQLLLSRVFLSLALNNRSKLLDRGREGSGGLLGTSQSTGLLASGLVQGQTDLEGTTRRVSPLLVAMDIWYDVVVLDHGYSFWFLTKR